MTAVAAVASTDTEHLPQLRAVLREGVANHYQDPAAWRGDARRCAAGIDRIIAGELRTTAG